ncbi:MAG: hypothetical protein ACXAEU_12860 [Candidatus Hodarchaeales archaeon]
MAYWIIDKKLQHIPNSNRNCGCCDNYIDLPLPVSECVVVSDDGVTKCIVVSGEGEFIVVSAVYLL